MGTCFLLSGLLSCIWNIFALVLGEIEREFGWTRVEVSLGFSLMALAHALSAPILSGLLARHDSRKVMAGLSLLLALGLASVPLTNSLPVFYLTFGLLTGIGTQAFGSYFIFALIVNRMPRQAARGMAIADAGAGAGLFVGLPLMQMLVAAGGWRSAFLALSGLALVVGLAAHLFVLPRLRIAGKRATGSRQDAAGSRRPAILLGASMLLGAAVLQGLQTQQIVAFEGLGAPAGTAVWVVSIGGLAMVASRLAAGFIADWHGPGFAMGVASAGALATFAAVAMFAAQGRPGWLMVYALALAAGFSAQGILFAAHARLIFPPRDFLSALSITRVCAGIGLFAGPLVAAAAFELSGGYFLMFTVLAALSAAHFMLFFAARPRLHNA